MAARLSRWTVTLLVVPALVGCSIGDVRRPPPPVATTPPVGVVTPVPGPSPIPFAEVRRTQVAVPERYDRPYVEFVDGQRGYALFAACDGKLAGSDCPALLWATVDGGRSWRKLRHPRPVAENQQLYAAPGLLLLFSEPHGYHLSTDGGATFTSSGTSPPPQWRAAQGRFQYAEETGQVAEWDGRRLRPLAVQPEVPGLNSVASHRDLVVAAGLRDGRPYAAISSDGGRNWRRQAMSVPDGEVGVLRAVVDSSDTAWLIGERPDRTTFPALWRSPGLDWEPVRADGHPERVGSVAAIGLNMLAVNGPDGVGVVTGNRYHRMGWPVTPEHHLTVLADGTLCARGPAGVVLAAALPSERRWVNVVLERR
ncbi:WD40/YVTN/BNR-like repeat-containing protein [Micromonospora cathayae]|uniref:BNR repeat-like domain-containing protein n=1 Tax=Micromonospora cathayae TaxID=3028804 RepID=A0ABY7ZT07_9ACTN|nr:hypothetical protein [Micromonospora sp. HUAS 3]WDZ86132.1 hypothetical protein PVK37_06850 [Micromonospora sp. HUAS 3]